jgi:hypothetical protein
MKTTTKIGTWNSRNLRESGRLRQSAACLQSYGLHILGMSEVRWNGFGEESIQDGVTFLCSGRPEGENVKERKWTAVCGLLCWARFGHWWNILPHKDCHKATWVSPDHKTENQIDHVAIGRKWRRSFLDARREVQTWEVTTIF